MLSTLRAAARASGLTQLELAQRIGASESGVSKALGGQLGPSSRVVRDLEDLLLEGPERKRGGMVERIAARLHGLPARDRQMVARLIERLERRVG